MQQTIEMGWGGLFTLSIFVLVFVLNSYATYAVIKSELATRYQKLAQISLIWLFPVIGSLMALAVHKKITSRYILLCLRSPPVIILGATTIIIANHNVELQD